MTSASSETAQAESECAPLRFRLEGPKVVSLAPLPPEEMEQFLNLPFWEAELQKRPQDPWLQSQVERRRRLLDRVRSASPEAAK